MRKRINRKALCSSENYRASRIAHQEYLKEQHEINKTAISMIAVSELRTEPLPDTLVFCMVFGKKTKMPYRRVKAAGFSYTLY